jgi:hypothetical protein
VRSLIKDATTIKIYGYTFKSREGTRSRKNLIAQANENSITTLIKKLETQEEKRNLIKERNPLHYIFGEKLVVKKGSESYEEYINRQYIGRI